MGGEQEVKDIHELADLLGVGIIRINSKKSGAAQSGVTGFEVGKFGYDPRGSVNGAITDKGYVYMFPDKNKTKWGFVLDTPHNREVLASHLAAPVLDVSDKKVKAEIIEWCIENGINTVPEAGANPYIKKSIPEKRLETRNKQLESDLLKAQLMLKKAEEAKVANDTALLRKEQYRDSNADLVVEQVQINPNTNEGELTEVEATSAALNQPAAKTVKTSKAN
jgi:hypothetical protein